MRTPDQVVAKNGLHTNYSALLTTKKSYPVRLRSYFGFVLRAVEW